MAGNIGVALNLVVGKINHVLPNFIQPTCATCMKNSRYLHLSKCILKYVFEYVSLHRLVRLNNHIS